MVVLRARCRCPGCTPAWERGPAMCISGPTNPGNPLLTFLQLLELSDPQSIFCFTEITAGQFSLCSATIGSCCSLPSGRGFQRQPAAPCARRWWNPGPHCRPQLSQEKSVCWLKKGRTPLEGHLLPLPCMVMGLNRAWTRGQKPQPAAFLQGTLPSIPELQTGDGICQNLTCSWAAEGSVGT